MKKIIGFYALAVACAYTTITASAQSLAFSLGGPKMRIIVVNNTSDNAPLLASVGNKTVQLGPGGQRWERDFGFSTSTDIPIFIQACSTTTPAFHFNQAPEWAQNGGRLGDLAITDDYLRTYPSEPALKARTKEIKNFIKNDLGHRAEDEELNEWLKAVIAEGISVRTTVCDSPKTIPLVAPNMFTYSYGVDKITMITVVGNAKDGYSIQNPARSTYSNY